MTLMNNGHAGVLAPTLGIVGCLKEYQQMSAGLFYALSMDSLATALRVATQVLADLDTDSRAVLVGCKSISAVVAGLADHQGPAELRSYSWRGTEASAVLHLTEQLDRTLTPRKRLILCLLSVETLIRLEKNIQVVLKGWRDWCENNGCILLVLVYGKQAAQACQTLAFGHRFISGIAHLKGQPNGFIYQLDYWINSLGVQSAAELELHDKNRQLVAIATTRNEAQLAPGEVFLQRSVLEGAPIFMAEKWRIAEDWQALVHSASEVASGTFVFALHANNEIEALARTLYGIRRQRGASVRLVVREMQQALRGQEEELLLQCGADLIVLVDTHLSRFFSKLEALQKQKTNRPLIENLESALAQIRTPKIQGVISVFELTTYIDQLLAHTMNSKAIGVLISLRPSSSLTAEQFIALLRIVRKGDVACVAEGVVYVFLLNCQMDFVDIILRKLFSLPLKDIVSAYVVHSDHASIEDQVRRLQLLPVERLAVVPKQIDNVLSSADRAAPSGQQAQVESIVFKPRLKPVSLHG